MSTPNPLIPQGTLPEARGKSHVRIAVFTILAIHMVLLGALLLQGCKRTADTANLADITNSYPPPSIETNFPAPPPVDTNPPAFAQTPPPEFAPATNVPTPPPFTPPATLTETPAAVTPPPTDTIGGGATEHVVVKGDSFYTLGKKYGVTTKAIAEANPNVDPTRLKIGQKLAIPAPARAASLGTGNGASASNGNGKTYTVKSGDTLARIARVHSTTVKALRSANNLRTDQIKVGQKLKIPSNGSAPDLGGVPPADAPAPGLYTNPLP